MKKINLPLSLLLVVGFVFLTSSTVIRPVSQHDDLKERMKKTNGYIESSLNDRKLTYQELKVAAEQIKGKKLSLRENCY